MKKEMVLKEWELRGFSGGEWVDLPGQIWEDYIHPTDELLMVMEGQLMIELGGRRLWPRVGEEVLIPANMPHTVRNVGLSEARWLYAYKKAAAPREDTSWAA